MVTRRLSLLSGALAAAVVGLAALLPAAGPASAQGTAPPPTPLRLMGRDQGAGILLQWSYNSVTFGTRGVAVERREVLNSLGLPTLLGFHPVATLFAGRDGVLPNVYLDYYRVRPGLTPGSVWGYRVRTFKRVGAATVWSAWSNEIAVDTRAGQWPRGFLTAPAEMWFQDTYVGSQRQTRFLVKNTGFGWITIKAAGLADGRQPFAAAISGPIPQSLGPQQSTMVVVRFLPQQPGYFDDEVILLTDNPGQPEVRIRLSGLGIARPR